MLWRKVKNGVWSLLNVIGVGGPIQLMLTGGLKDDGWYKSFETKRSVDNRNEPIPWCTYPFIKFIGPRLKPHFDVFEYGCGNSTRWYAQKVHSIKAVEHDGAWVGMIAPKLPSNASVEYVELQYDGAYCRHALAGGGKYHLIIVDGRDRNNCVKNSIGALHADGVIIFDNADLPDYVDGVGHLLSQGFRRIDFMGLSPVTPHNNCTSIFYKDGNCLGI